MKSSTVLVSAIHDGRLFQIGITRGINENFLQFNLQLCCLIFRLWPRVLIWLKSNSPSWLISMNPLMILKRWIRSVVTCRFSKESIFEVFLGMVYSWVLLYICHYSIVSLMLFDWRKHGWVNCPTSLWVFPVGHQI